VPVGVIGIMLVLSALLAFLFGVFTLSNLLPYSKKPVGAVLIALAIIIFIYAMCLKTDYSDGE